LRDQLLFSGFKSWLRIKRSTPHSIEEKFFFVNYIYGFSYLAATFFRGKNYEITTDIIIEVPNSKYERFTTIFDGLENKLMISSQLRDNNRLGLLKLKRMSLSEFFRGLLLLIRVRSDDRKEFSIYYYRFLVAERLVKNEIKFITFDGFSPLSCALYSLGILIHYVRPTTTYDNIENSLINNYRVYVRTDDERPCFPHCDVRVIGFDLSYINYCSLERKERVLLIDTVVSKDVSLIFHCNNLRRIVTELKDVGIDFKFHPGSTSNYRKRVIEILQNHKDYEVVDEVEFNYDYILGFDSTILLDAMWSGAYCGNFGSVYTGKLTSAYRALSISQINNDIDLKGFLDKRSNQSKIIEEICATYKPIGVKNRFIKNFFEH
jgi:hypothetical protein